MSGITKKSYQKVGKKFNRLMCVSLTWDEARRKTMGSFQCDCGEILVAGLANVAVGNTKSCGCLNKEALDARNRVHGMSHTKIYDIWCEMIARCTRQSHARYSDYGGRGITVSEEWRQFNNFYADMGDRPEGTSLERRNNFLGYSKENCLWDTIGRQNTNKRNNRHITAYGRSLPITWWGELVGLGSSHLGELLNKNNNIEDIIMIRIGSIGVDQL